MMWCFRHEDLVATRLVFKALVTPVAAHKWMPNLLPDIILANL